MEGGGPWLCTSDRHRCFLFYFLAILKNQSLADAKQVEEITQYICSRASNVAKYKQFSNGLNLIGVSSSFFTNPNYFGSRFQNILFLRCLTRIYDMV